MKKPRARAVNGPIFVPLRIRARVCAAPNYLPSEVEKALLETFSNRDIPDGRRGFFHPDNFTLGQPVNLSKLYETAIRVNGVASINFDIFERWEEERADDEDLPPPPPIIEMHFLEVARLDNDPNFPEYGKIEFVVESGL